MAFDWQWPEAYLENSLPEGFFIPGNSGMDDAIPGIPWRLGIAQSVAFRVRMISVSRIGYRPTPAIWGSTSNRTPSAGTSGWGKHQWSNGSLYHCLTLDTLFQTVQTYLWNATGQPWSSCILQRLLCLSLKSFKCTKNSSFLKCNIA